jgi:ABC-type phosphate transport system substrate-binding protein
MLPIGYASWQERQMSHDGSNADKKSAGHAIRVAVMGAVRAIVAMLIAGGAVWLSHGGGSGTNLAAVTTSSQRTASLNSSSPTPVPSSTESASMPNKSTRCATGSLLLIGSTAFTPIARGAADAYELICRNATISVNSVKDQEEADAYELACPYVTISVNLVKNADSAYGLTQVQDEVLHHCKDAGSMIAMYDGVYSGTVGLRPYPMGALIFSVVANRGGRFGLNITPDELRTIFVQLGEQGVIAVGRPAGSGSRKAFFANVLHLNPAPPPYKNSCPPPTGIMSCTEDTTAGMLDFVNKTPNAIGYAEVNEPSSSDLQVYQLAIDGAMPTPDEVAKGKYSFWTIEHLYVSVQASVLTKDFLDFLPQYLASYRASDFAACSYARTLEAACYPAIQTSPRPKSGKSAPRAFDTLFIWLLVALAILIIFAFLVASHLKHWPWVVKRPWWEGFWHRNTSQIDMLASRRRGTATTDTNGPPGEGAERNGDQRLHAAQRDQSGHRRAASVFVSYAHKDKSMRDDLSDHLGGLRYGGYIKDWSDGQIVPGHEWAPEIIHRLDEADIILLLVTSSFLGSEFIGRVELTRAPDLRQRLCARS